MTTLFVIGMMMIGLFGYAVGAYLALYKFDLKSNLSKVLTFLLAGTAVAFLTFFVSVFIVWPGV